MTGNGGADPVLLVALLLAVVPSAVLLIAGSGDGADSRFGAYVGSRESDLAHGA